MPCYWNRIADDVTLSPTRSGLSGCGSLTALWYVTPDALVLDRQFSSPLSRSGTKQAVKAAVAVDNSYGIEVVATGVDSLEQAQRLALCGVTHAQGDLCGPATPSRAAAAARGSTKAKPKKTAKPASEEVTDAYAYNPRCSSGRGPSAVTALWRQMRFSPDSARSRS
jgi:predicted signal transduction protein with EAL and GGDEF domain